MSRRIAITIHRDREEVARLWREAGFVNGATFVDAPGDRGTEIHLEAERGAQAAKLKDRLRHFKQRVETGEVPRSDGTPEGERFERRLRQRPAQPLREAELAEVLS
jgi:hypothetical protein